MPTASRSVPIPSCTALSAVVLSFALTAAGCSPATETSGGSTGAGTGSTPSRERVPDCGAVAAALGGAVEGWTPNEDNGFFAAPDGDYGVSCTWASPRTQSSNAFEVFEGGAVALTLSVERTPMSPGALRAMGWVIEDPRVERINGAIVVPGGQLDLAAPLGAVGPQVISGPVVVVASSTGMMLNRYDEGAVITNDDVIEAAITLIQNMR